MEHKVLPQREPRRVALDAGLPRIETRTCAVPNVGDRKCWKKYEVLSSLFVDWENKDAVLKPSETAFVVLCEPEPTVVLMYLRIVPWENRRWSGC